MLRTRKAYIHKARSVSDSQSLTEDIKIKDPISAILVTYQATTGATSNQGHYPYQDVDTLRVADGSDIIFNLDGTQCLAHNFLESGKMPYRELDEGAAATMREQFIMRFGRWIGDPLYYLDPGKYLDLNLTLEHTLEISATAGFATNTGQVTAEAIIFADKPPAAEGCLMTKSQHKWSTAASGDEPINLPVDYPYRMIGLRAFETTVGFHESLTNVKLSCNGDAFIPVDILPLDLVRENHAILASAKTNFKAFRTDADTFPVELGYVDSAFANAINDLDVAGIDAIDDDSVTLQLLSLTVAPAVAKSVADTAIWVTAEGKAFLNSAAIFFGDKDDPLDFFPARQFDKIEAKITQGNAGAAASMWVQQVRN